MIPYICALLSLGSIGFVVVGDLRLGLFDAPAPKEEKVVLLVNTMGLDERGDGGSWLPISALTKDHQDNWVVYSIEEQIDNRQKVIPFLVDVQRMEKDSALIIASATFADNDSSEYGERLIMADGLHLVVPGQIVRTSVEGSH